MNEVQDAIARSKQIKQGKKLAASLDQSNPENLQPTDMLFVLHEDEAEVLEETLLDVISGEPIKLSREDKKCLIQVIKYIQEGRE